jgi:hypothetical protein
VSYAEGQSDQRLLSPAVLAFDWGLVLSVAGAVAGAVATLFIWRVARLAVPQLRPSAVEVRTTDDELLYREQALPDAAAKGRRVVTIDRPQPGMGQHDVMVLVAREIIRGLRTQPASQPSVLPWLIPALLVFAVGVGGLIVNLVDEPEPDVDCVAYVQSLTELVAANTSEIDGAALAISYGKDVVDNCGEPTTFLTAIGR